MGTRLLSVGNGLDVEVITGTVTGGVADEDVSAGLRLSGVFVVVD